MKLPEILEKINSIIILLCPKDEEALYKYASQVPEGGWIIDIGTAAGGSAFIMGLASKPSVLLNTIDPNFNENVPRNIKEFGLEEKVIYVQSTSADFSKLLKEDSVDMLFIDGVHNYDGVMDDFNNYYQKVKKGGIIAFHDVLLYDDTIGKAVKEIIASGKVKELETIKDIYQDERLIGLTVTKKL